MANAEKPEAYNKSKVEGEAEARRFGGRRKRKHGGEVHSSNCKCSKCMGGAAKANGGGVAKKHGGGISAHHENMEDLDHAKHVGKVVGSRNVANAGRKARASGGATSNPLSSAASGSPATGRKLHGGYKLDES